MCLSAKVGEQHRAWACTKPALAQKLRVWREAKRSILIALGTAAALLTVLATYTQLMPPLPVWWMQHPVLRCIRRFSLAFCHGFVGTGLSQHLVGQLIQARPFFIVLKYFPCHRLATGLLYDSFHLYQYLSSLLSEMLFKITQQNTW